MCRGADCSRLRCLRRCLQAPLPTPSVPDVACHRRSRGCLGVGRRGDGSAGKGVDCEFGKEPGQPDGRGDQPAVDASHPVQRSVPAAGGVAEHDYRPA